MKQTLKVGAMLLAVAALAMTGVAVAQSGEDTVFDEAPPEASAPGDKIMEWLAPLIADGTIDETQAQAVAETIADKLPHPRGPMGRAWQVGREAADFLGLTLTEIGEAMHDGQTLAEIATAQGQTPEALIDHLVGAAAERLDDLVADGRITEDEKAGLLEEATARLTDLVNGEFERPLCPGGPGMGRGRHGGMGEPGMVDQGELEELGT